MQVAPNQWHLSDKSTAGKRWNPGRSAWRSWRSGDEDFLRAISTPHRGRGLAGLLLLELCLDLKRPIQGWHGATDLSVDCRKSRRACSLVNPRDRPSR